MPTYDYECLECKHRFEVFQSMTDKPVEKCVKCGAKVRKLIGPGAGIIFKGSGFYVNDYKKSSSATNGASTTSKTAGSTEAASSSSGSASGSASPESSSVSTDT